MSEYTREEILEKVKNGESLKGTDLSDADLGEDDLGNVDLSGADLSGANFRKANLYFADLSGANLSDANLVQADLGEVFLCEANLERANLSGVDFWGANLEGAKFIEANLTSVDFEDADLKNADISGSNIYHIKTHDWEIDGIKCTHAYLCYEELWWSDNKKREKYRRDFAPGEFEALYKSLPKIELIFQQGFTPDDLGLLTIIIEQINNRLSSPLDMSEMKKGLNTSVSLTAENNEILKQALPMIQEMYQKLENKNERILKLTDEKHQLDQRISELAGYNQALIRAVPENPKQFNMPEMYVDNRHIDNRQYYNSKHLENCKLTFSSPEDAEEIVQQIITRLKTSQDPQKTLTEIDKELSPQLDNPEKKKWFQAALRKSKSTLTKYVPKIAEGVTVGAAVEMIAKVLIG